LHSTYNLILSSYATTMSYMGLEMLDGSGLPPLFELDMLLGSELPSMFEPEVNSDYVADNDFFLPNSTPDSDSTLGIDPNLLLLNEGPVQTPSLGMDPGFISPPSASASAFNAGVDPNVFLTNPDPVEDYGFGAAPNLLLPLSTPALDYSSGVAPGHLFPPSPPALGYGSGVASDHLLPVSTPAVGYGYGVVSDHFLTQPTPAPSYGFGVAPGGAFGQNVAQTFMGIPGFGNIPSFTDASTSNIVPGMTSNIAPGLLSLQTPNLVSGTIHGVSQLYQAPGMTNNVAPGLLSLQTPNVISGTFQGISHLNQAPEVRIPEPQCQDAESHICQWNIFSSGFQFKCSQEFSSAQALDSHVNHDHLAQIEPPAKWACAWNHCGKEFGSRCKLARHAKSHTGYKAHRCPGCSKSFSTSDQLKCHKNSCEKSRPFKCPMWPACSYGTSTKTGVNTHYFCVHTNVKKYNCYICSYGVSDGSNFAKHEKKSHGFEKGQYSSRVPLKYGQLMDWKIAELWKDHDFINNPVYLKDLKARGTYKELRSQARW
jgi:hypothetical protein